MVLDAMRIVSKYGELAIDTFDMGEMARVTAQQYGDHHFRQLSGFTERSAHICTLAAGDICLSRFRWGAAASVATESLDTFYLISLPITGHEIFGQDGKSLEVRPGLAGVFSPWPSFYLEATSGMETLVIQIPKAIVDRTAQALWGAPSEFPLIFDMRVASGGGFDRYLRAFLSNVRQWNEWSGDSILQRRFGNMITDSIASALVMLQPSNWPAPQTNRRVMRQRELVHNAIDLMEAHVFDPVSLAHIALKCGTSHRALTVAFQNYFGTSPGKWFVDRRLMASRDLLRNPSDPTTTIASVATHLGFVNAGDFARYYRRRFGEKPSETLKRSLGRSFGMSGF